MKLVQLHESWEDPKTVVKPYFDHKTNPLGPQKDKNDPKIKSNFNVTINGIIENENCSTTWVEPKTLFEPLFEPEKTTPKLSQSQLLKVKETKKII